MTGPKNARSVNGRRFYTYRGQQLESVTSLISRGYPKQWLGFWAAKTVAEAAVAGGDWQNAPTPEEKVALLKRTPWEKRDTAGDHGTTVHEALAALARGATSYRAPKALQPHVKAVGDFWRAYRPTPVFVESQVFSLTHGYAGSLDLAAWIYGRLLLIDAKTSTVISHEMQVQLAAYRFADFIGEDDKVLAPMPAVQGAAILWIPRERPEQWQLIEVPVGQEEFRDFLTVKQTAEMVSRTDGQSIGELILPQVAA